MIGEKILAAQEKEIEKRFGVANNNTMAMLLGVGDAHLNYLTQLTTARVTARGTEFILRGAETEVIHVEKLLKALVETIEKEGNLDLNQITYLNGLLKKNNKEYRTSDIVTDTLVTTMRGKSIKARTLGQKHYIQAILRNDITFGIGPAGTGKTYLAVAMAVRALRNKDVERIILVRPAVEAGEKLGFLPGDFIEKINPYLRPLYDSLFDILGVEITQRYLDKHIIEIAPLAYMRGRTLNDAFIILDEAQNTTPQQMKMFLTRLGFSSKAIITGDVTQVDLPKEETSGLVKIQEILENVKGIAFEHLSREDVVRHPLVQKIIDAYDRYESKEH